MTKKAVASTKRKREASEEVIADSEDELDCSQLDPTAKEEQAIEPLPPPSASPQTPRRTKRIMEVVITTPPPRKRLRLSPEH